MNSKMETAGLISLRAKNRFRLPARTLLPFLACFGLSSFLKFPTLSYDASFGVRKAIIVLG